jgi:hypothetical protein
VRLRACDRRHALAAASLTSVPCRDLQVWVTSSTDFVRCPTASPSPLHADTCLAPPQCVILPRAKYSTIGDSEFPGGAKSYCTKRYDSSQGKASHLARHPRRVPR